MLGKARLAVQASKCQQLGKASDSQHQARACPPPTPPAPRQPSRTLGRAPAPHGWGGLALFSNLGHHAHAASWRRLRQGG